MSTPRLVLFDDALARDWRPFTLTRPAGELLFGHTTLRRRAEAALALTCVGHVTGSWLSEFHEPWAPPVLEAPGAAEGPEGTVYMVSRFVAEPAALPRDAALLVSEGRVVGCRLTPGAPAPDPAFFDDPEGAAPDLPRHELRGVLLERVWQLMSGNADRLARDLATMEPSPIPDHAHHVGSGAVSLGRGVTVAPGVVFDTRAGSIRLEQDVEVRPFTYLVGPAHIGAGSVLLGGPFSAVTIGPRCKVHGEVEETVVLGYSNKAHDGFLGHAYLGMWVNLGALTTNSDLKNNYGTVRVWTPGGDTDTGQTKIGCFLGDHVKTAIGTMVNTGTVIEAASNIFGGMPAKYVPPFSWGDAESDYDVDRFLDTARTVMGRRDVELTPQGRRLLQAARAAGRGSATRPAPDR